MKKHYVTFGQIHTHSVEGKTLDKDTVAYFPAANHQEGREKAFRLFGEKFFTDYHNTEWDENDLHYFPKGYVYLS